MGIKVGEVGKTIYVGTAYDMSSETSLAVQLYNPDGTTGTAIADGDITLNSGTYDASSFGLGTFAANESIQFDTTADMFDADQIASGESSAVWTGVVTYVDSGKTLKSNTFSLTVEAVP